MAATKKTAAAAAAAKVEEPKTTAVNTVNKSATVVTAKKETAKKETAKRETAKEAEKETVKEAVKKETAKKEPDTNKAENTLTGQLHIQFGGKSYSQEELLKIAKDVWEYDLHQKPEALTSVELYVKPEESMVYYVMNKETVGSFAI